MHQRLKATGQKLTRMQERRKEGERVAAIAVDPKLTGWTSCTIVESSRCGAETRVLFHRALTHESPDGRPPLFEPLRPVNLYDLVGRGRLHLLSGSHVELPRAVEAFRAAIALDPTYAPAPAGLARAWCVQAVLRAVPHQKAFAEGIGAARARH